MKKRRLPKWTHIAHMTFYRPREDGLMITVDLRGRHQEPGTFTVEYNYTGATPAELSEAVRVAFEYEQRWLKGEVP